MKYFYHCIVYYLFTIYLLLLFVPHFIISVAVKCGYIRHRWSSRSDQKRQRLHLRRPHRNICRQITKLRGKSWLFSLTPISLNSYSLNLVSMHLPTVENLLLRSFFMFYRLFHSSRFWNAAVDCLSVEQLEAI